jgi:hypothetical protein
MPDVIRNLAIAPGVTSDPLLFGADQRGPDGELRLQFEAVSRFSVEGKKVVRSLPRPSGLSYGIQNQACPEAYVHSGVRIIKTLIRFGIYSCEPRTRFFLIAAASLPENRAGFGYPMRVALVTIVRLCHAEPGQLKEERQSRSSSSDSRPSSANNSADVAEGSTVTPGIARFSAAAGCVAEWICFSILMETCV